MYYVLLCIMYWGTNVICRAMNKIDIEGLSAGFFMEYLSYIIQSGAPVVKLFIVIHPTADTIWLFHIAMENHHF